MRFLRYSVIALALLASNCGLQVQNQPSGEAQAQAVLANDATFKTAVFAGGCFWCVEADFDKLDGVVQTLSGYAGGSVDNPSYRQVVSGNTGHYEVVEITYDPAIVSYDELVSYFWRHVDPTDPGGQFCDRGDSYRTAIFVDGPAERATAQASREALDASGELIAPIVTPILEHNGFWPAEAYHQDYYEKNPLRYRYYRSRCGRDKRIEKVWSGEVSGDRN